MEKLGDGVKKVLLAGIGAVAVTAEKSRELLDEMVKKGELTVEQGKVLNEELKHNIKKTVKDLENKLSAFFILHQSEKIVISTVPAPHPQDDKKIIMAYFWNICQKILSKT